MGPPGVPAYSLGAVTGHSTGGHPGRSQGSHWDKEAESGVEEAEGGVPGRVAERDGCMRQRQRSAVAPRGVFVLLSSLPMGKPRRLERSSKRSKQSNPQSSHGQEAVHASATQNFREKPWNIWCSGHSSQKITVLVVWGQISPRLKFALDPPREA